MYVPRTLLALCKPDLLFMLGHHLESLWTRLLLGSGSHVGLADIMATQIPIVEMAKLDILCPKKSHVPLVNLASSLSLGVTQLPPRPSSHCPHDQKNWADSPNVGRKASSAPSRLQRCSNLLSPSSSSFQLLCS